MAKRKVRAPESKAAQAAAQENRRVAEARAKFLTGELPSERVMRETTAMGLQIFATEVIGVRALQHERRALREKLDKLEADLKTRERPIIVAIKAGLPFEPGCPPCALDVEERVTPRWKDEALVLARAQGMNAEVYEAQVRARTKPTLIERLVINGDVGRT